MSQLKNKKNMENFGLNFVHQILSSSNFKCTSTLIMGKKILFKSITITIKIKCKQEFCIEGYMNSIKCYKRVSCNCCVIACIQLPCSCTGFFPTINYLKKWIQLEAQNYSINYGNISSY